MRIAVYGAGSVGGYFGGRLAQAGSDVRLIARGPHLAALREHGLRVRGVQGDFTVRVPATDDQIETSSSPGCTCVNSESTSSQPPPSRRPPRPPEGIPNLS